MVLYCSLLLRNRERKIFNDVTDTSQLLRNSLSFFKQICSNNYWSTSPSKIERAFVLFLYDNRLRITDDPASGNRIIQLLLISLLLNYRLCISRNFLFSLMIFHLILVQLLVKLIRLFICSYYLSYY